MLSDKEASVYWEERAKKFKKEREELDEKIGTLMTDYMTLKRKYNLALEELKKMYELENKLAEAKEWLVEIAEFSEDRSDFERYMKREWNYER